MKNIYKIILSLAICICLALPFAGCNRNCGGIVKSFEIKDVYREVREDDMMFEMGYASGYYPQLRVTFKRGKPLSDNCRCSELTIYTYDFENYGANKLDELLTNTDFLNILQEEHRISSIWVVNNVTTPTTYIGGTDTLAYLLYYDFYDEHVENPSDYKGYIKVN